MVPEKKRVENQLRNAPYLNAVRTVEIAPHFPRIETVDYWRYARKKLDNETNITSWETNECYHRDWAYEKVKFSFDKNQSLLLHELIGFNAINFSSFKLMKELIIRKKSLTDEDWKWITVGIPELPSKELSDVYKIFIETEKIDDLHLLQLLGAILDLKQEKVRI